LVLDKPGGGGGHLALVPAADGGDAGRATARGVTARVETALGVFLNTYVRKLRSG
jgi:hypothetical protein